MIFNITQGGSDPTLKKLIDGSISTIEIDGVEKIRDYAFYNCGTITSVEIKNGVTTIGENAFYGCKFKDITIPPSINNIGSAAFNVTTLSKVNITDLAAWCNITFGTGDYTNPLTRGENLYINDELVTDLVIPENVVSISNDAFWGCSSLKTITIPDSVVSIGSSVFRACDNISTAHIGNGVTTIGYSAFYACKSLANVTLENGLTTLGYQAFHNCTSLASIELPDSLTTIDGSTFYGCTKLSNVTVGNGLTTIGSSAFYNCTSLTNINFPNSLTTINGGAFQNCTSLTSIEIPQNVTTIGNSAFRSCTALEEINFNAATVSDLGSSNYVFYNAGKNGNGIKVTIGSNVTKIPTFLFAPLNSSSYSPNITSVEFEDGSVCESIGQNAFYYCSKIPNIIIPDSVTSIGYYAFCSCSALSSIMIGSGITSIGEYAFRYDSVATFVCKALTPPTIQSTTFTNMSATCSFYVPLASIDAYKSATNWSARATYIFPYVETEADLTLIDTTAYTKANVNGIVYNYDGTTWIAEEQS